MSRLNGTHGRPDPAPRPHDARHELLAGRVLGDLSREEMASLAPGTDTLRAEVGLESAAGSLYLAIAGGEIAAAEIQPEAVPADVLTRLYRLAEAYIAARTEAPIAVEPLVLKEVHARPSPWPRWSRLAIAASLALAAAGWLAALRPWAPSSESPGASSPIDLRRAVLARADAVTLSWGEWSDDSVTAEVKGVAGDVVWSDEAQSGVMRFTGLPDLPGSVYQLWIIDAERGMSQRVSGAIFEGGDEVTVRVDPQLHINHAAAFAVTIEQPGGTWVSDMTRRVVIAARAS